MRTLLLLLLLYYVIVYGSFFYLLVGPFRQVYRSAGVRTPFRFILPRLIIPIIGAVWCGLALLADAREYLIKEKF